MRKWLTTRWWGMDEREREAIRRAGLTDFDDFMAGSLGQPFKRKPFLEIHRLQPAPGETWYLKRSLQQPLGDFPTKVLRMLRRRERAHTEAFHVHSAAVALESLGFDVMRVIAWGEESVLGMPIRGFVLAQEAPGRDASELFEEMEGEDLRRLMLAVGRLLGRLHAMGLFLTLRLHDLFVQEESAGIRLTMIDLDFKGGVRPTEWEASASIESLAACCYLFLRWGHRLSAREFRAFRTGFSGALGAAGVAIPSRFFLDVRRAVDRRLSQHFLDARRSATFPETPRSTRSARARMPGPSRAAERMAPPGRRPDGFSA